MSKFHLKLLNQNEYVQEPLLLLVIDQYKKLMSILLNQRKSVSKILMFYQSGEFLNEKEFNKLFKMEANL